MKNIKKILCLALVALFATTLGAQTLQLEAAALANKEAKLYYFAGDKVDSLLSKTDKLGKATFTLPSKDYRGMVALVVADGGGLEVVLAEPTLHLAVEGNTLSGETVAFPQSKENQFLKYSFTSQGQNLQKQGWLQAGMQFYAPTHPLAVMLQQEEQAASKAVSDLQAEVKKSELYASQYFQLSEYMNRLFDAENQRNSKLVPALIDEMENSLDIAALYYSGQLWGSVHNFYLSLFSKNGNEKTKQLDYAQSVLTTLNRLTDPYYSAYLASIITETERFSWHEAQEKILSTLLVRDPNLQIPFPAAQRVIGAYRAKELGIAPQLVGLAKTDKAYAGGMLVAFYDSGCNSCANEMNALGWSLAKFKEKDIRIVSVSADSSKEAFEEGNMKHPWDDKLCDFEGFEGVNFNNFGVIGSPSFYYISKDGKVLGQYYKVSDMEFLK